MHDVRVRDIPQGGKCVIDQPLYGLSVFKEGISRWNPKIKK